MDQLCKPEVYLMSFTYHMMGTTIFGENMPQVPLELLNHVYYSMIDQGPGFPTTFIGDQLQWKPKCSKCGKFMYNKCHDLYTCVITTPLIVLIHDGLVAHECHHLWYDGRYFNESGFHYLFSNHQALRNYLNRFLPLKAETRQ